MKCLTKLSVCLVFVTVTLHGVKAALLEDCSGDSDCTDAGGDLNAVCEEEGAVAEGADRNCICTGAFKNNEDDTGCVPKGLLDECGSNDDCRIEAGDPNAVCAKVDDTGGDADGNCICTGAYKNNENDDGCDAKGLLDECDSNDDCRVEGGDPNAVCAKVDETGGDADGNCICTGAYKNNENDDGCVAKSLGDTCDANSDCAESAVDNSVCSTEKECACEANYIGENAACKKVLGGTCSDDTDCTGTVDNSVCTGGTCECKANYDEKNAGCTKVLGGTCNDESDCTDEVDNSVCTEGKCECKANYIEESAACKTALGQACTGAGQGTCVSNAECAQTCKCSPGFKDTNGLCAAESSATSVWMASSLLVTSMLIYIPRLFLW